MGGAQHRRAAERLRKTERRALSLVGCTSFVLMDAEGIREALALGGEFRTVGYRLLPDG